MLTLIVKVVIKETEDTNTYIVESSDQRNIEYKAGQFITLILNRNGKELRRSYSISTAPGFDHHISFTIKEVTNGEVSRYLLRHLRPGSLLTAMEPSGRFVYEPSLTARDIYLIAAGSGVTPVYSLLKQIVSTPAEY